MTDRSVTAASALAAAEMTRPQSEGGTATQRMAAARTDDEMSPFESNEGPSETQHASTTTPAAAAADGGRCSTSMPTPARATPWQTAQGEVHARDSQERRAGQRMRSIKRLELEAQLRELKRQERIEPRRCGCTRTSPVATPAQRLLRLVEGLLRVASHLVRTIREGHTFMQTAQGRERLQWVGGERKRVVKEKGSAEQ